MGAAFWAVALLRFDGPPIGEVGGEVRRELGLELDPPTLRTLAEFGLLVQAGAA